MEKNTKLENDHLRAIVIDAIGYISNFFGYSCLYTKTEGDFSGLKEFCDEQKEGSTNKFKIINDNNRSTFFGVNDFGEVTFNLSKPIKRSDIGHEVGHFIHYFMNPDGYNKLRDLGYKYQGTEGYLSHQENLLAYCCIETIADYAEFVYLYPNLINFRFKELNIKIEYLKETDIEYVSNILPFRDSGTLKEKNANLCHIHLPICRHLKQFEKNEEPLII